MLKEFVFFSESSHPFSQWYTGASFVKHGLTFPTTENYVMWRKGKLFDAPQALLDRLISVRAHEATSKHLRMPNFDRRIWRRFVRPCVAEANYAKFAQNAQIRRTLLATAGTKLVEAAPWDTAWGIALLANDPHAFDRGDWLGTNWRGEVLTEVRDTMIADGTASS